MKPISEPTEFNPEDEGIRYLRNFSISRQNYTVSQQCFIILREHHTHINCLFQTLKRMNDLGNLFVCAGRRIINEDFKCILLTFISEGKINVPND